MPVGSAALAPALPDHLDASDELIDATQVADILGLTHRNSVSTYRHRYPDFPSGRPAPGGGRTRLWRRGDVEAWHEAFRLRRTGAPGAENPRLQELVEATAKLMLEHPGVDISIRQIAAEAGVAHSDLYRYATSKEQLRSLAIDHIVFEVGSRIPNRLSDLLEAVVPLLAATKSTRPAMAVLAHEMIVGAETPLTHDLGVVRIAEALEARSADSPTEDHADPRVVAACIGAMSWGLFLFERRWLMGLGIDDLPLDDVAVVVRAMLDA